MPPKDTRRPLPPLTAQFVDLNLDKKQKDELAENASFKASWHTFFDAISADGLKFTLKWDDRNQCALAMLQKAAYNPEIAPVIWVLRSSSMSGAALKIAYYFALCEGQLPVPGNRKDIERDDELLW